MKYVVYLYAKQLIDVGKYLKADFILPLLCFPLFVQIILLGRKELLSRPDIVFGTMLSITSVEEVGFG